MKNIIYIILTFLFVSAFAQPLFAKGDIRRLKGIQDGLNQMDMISEQEAENYQKTKDFLAGADIRQGLSADDVIARCGEPVATANNNTRWVYKPPSSTFFEGEKIYLFFDTDGNLINWEQINQK